MNLKPLFDNVLIEKEVENKTISGILIPDSTKYQKGTIVAIGSGTKDSPMELKSNQKVLFNEENHNYKQKINNKEYILAKQSQVLALIE